MSLGERFEHVRNQAFVSSLSHRFAYVADARMIQPPIVVPSQATSAFVDATRGAPWSTEEDAGLLMSAIHFQYVYSLVFELIEHLERCAERAEPER